MVLYLVTWIPSIYPSHVSIYTSTMDPMGYGIYTPTLPRTCGELMMKGESEPSMIGGYGSRWVLNLNLIPQKNTIRYH